MSPIPEHKFDAYYLGLDIGTDSVGWAVTDLSYNILRYRGKDMWGVHLFESANTAAERRKFRTARRRRDRARKRLEWFRELMGEAINAVDPGFFRRLEPPTWGGDENGREIDISRPFRISCLFNVLFTNLNNFDYLHHQNHYIAVQVEFVQKAYTTFF